MDSIQAQPGGAALFSITRYASMKENSLIVTEFLALPQPIYCTAKIARWYIKRNEMTQLSLPWNSRRVPALWHKKKLHLLVFIQGLVGKDTSRRVQKELQCCWSLPLDILSRKSQRKIDYSTSTRGHRDVTESLQSCWEGMSSLTFMSRLVLSIGDWWSVVSFLSL